METKVEQQERIQVEAQLNALGFETIYGGGRASKGHGFWIKGKLNPKNQKDMPGSTFHTIEECHNVITQTETIELRRVSKPGNPNASNAEYRDVLERIDTNEEVFAVRVSYDSIKSADLADKAMACFLMCQMPKGEIVEDNGFLV